MHPQATRAKTHTAYHEVSADPGDVNGRIIRVYEHGTGKLLTEYTITGKSDADLKKQIHAWLLGEMGKHARDSAEVVAIRAGKT